MADFSSKDFSEGKVLCSLCGKAILDPTKCMRHRPTDTYYHEDSCFEKRLVDQLERRGLDTAGMPSGLMDTIKDLFNIPSSRKEAG